MKSKSGGVLTGVKSPAIILDRQVNYTSVLVNFHSHSRCESVFANICQRFLHDAVQGALSFVNNTVDTTTGTIQLSGEFDNTEGKLFPGQYVNATLTLTQEPNATVIPDRAVQNGPNGQFVFVVKPDMTVENQPVTIGPSINGLDVIRKGIKPGDRVVIDGQANLVSGSKISIKNGNIAEEKGKKEQITNNK